MQEFVGKGQQDADAIRVLFDRDPTLRGKWVELNRQLVYAKALLREYERHYPEQFTGVSA